MNRRFAIGLFALAIGPVFCLAGAQDSPQVEFTSVAYYVQANNPYERDFQIVQERARFDASGFVDFTSRGHSSQPLLEFPCTSERELCWISLLPRLVAVYPKECFPTCVEWGAFGFKFRRDGNRLITIGKERLQAIAYLVHAPNGEAQLQLVSPRLGLVAFSDFHSPDESGPHPVFLRDSPSGVLFPFESNAAQIDTMNYSGFAEAYGIDWRNALNQGRVIMPP